MSELAVDANDGDKYVVYHAGHYGYIVKSLIHSMTHHPNEKLIILFDEMNCSDKTLAFIKENEKKFNFGKLYIYSEKIFWNDVSEEEEETIIKDYFDGILEEYKANVVCYYSGCDDRNAFAAYMHISGQEYSLFDVNSQTYWEMYDRIDRAHPNWYAYNTILRKYRCLNNDAKNVKEIIWDRENHRDVPHKQNTTISFNQMFKGLTAEKQKRLKQFFKVPSILEERHLLLLSSSHFTYSGPEILRSLQLEDRFVFPYYLVLDLLNIETKDLVVKAHPFYDQGNDKICQLFGGCTYINGFVPADIMELSDDFKICDVISIETTSANFCCSEAKHISFNSLYTMSAGYLPLSAILTILMGVNVKKITHNMRKTAFVDSLNRIIFDNYFDFELIKINEETDVVLLDSSEADYNQDLALLSEDKNVKNIIVFNGQMQLGSVELSIPTDYYKMKIESIDKTRFSKLLEVNQTYIVTSFASKKLQDGFKQNSFEKIYKNLGVRITIQETENLSRIKEYDDRKIQQIIRNINKNDVDQGYYISVLEEGYARNIKGAEIALGQYYWNNNRKMITDKLRGDIEANSDKKPDAQLLLGKIYHFGIGVEKNDEKASLFLRKAVKNYKWASNLLFDALWNVNTEKTDKEMVDVITKLVLAGNADSIFRLAQAFKHGRGVDKNMDLYDFWLNVAAERGSKSAQDLVNGRV